MMTRAKDPADLKGTSVRLPAELLARLEKWAKRKGVAKRSDAIRMLIALALEHEEAKQQPQLSRKLVTVLEAYREEVKATSLEGAVAELIERAEATFTKEEKRRLGKMISGLAGKLGSFVA
jgi:metal-responsive CopG/Arc/MetJ family transcriptional regulator